MTICTPRCTVRKLEIFPGAILLSGCAASEEFGWPDETWPVSTAEAEGVDRAALDSFIADIDAGRYGLIDQFLLIRNGRVIADRRWDHAERYAELLAAQEDTADHQYDYDHPLWHPYYRDTDLHSLQSVTSLEDFLTMRSGIDWAVPGQTYDDDTHPTTVLETSDRWIDYVVAQPVGTEPGTRFDYNDGVSVLLGKIVREATGQRLDAWAEERLFRPIGTGEYYWEITPDGEVDSEGGLYLSTHDLARIGYLMLRGGEWDGRQTVSRAWVEASTSPVVPDVAPENDRPDAGYGYQWWVPLHERTELFSWTALQDRILPAIVSTPDDLR